MAGPQSIKDHGWRQGSVLPAELAQRVAVPRFAEWGPDDRAILLSQDCDVVHASYEAEPLAELIRAKVSSVEEVLTPPLASLPMTFASWVERLPETLWASLLIAGVGRERALGRFR